MNFSGGFERWARLLRFAALAVLVLAACGGGASSPSDGGTSALSFQVVWDRPDYQRESLTDCLDVATVTAAVYTESGDLLGEGGPWDCATGSGVISALPANYYVTIQVAGYGPDGSPLYSGQSGAPVFLTPGSVDGGLITAGPFVPQLLAPADAAIVAPDDLTLQWASLVGAAAYHVTLADSLSFAAETIVDEYDVVSPAITSLQPDTTGLILDQPYYWRVVGLSAGGLPGAASEIRQFALRAVTITDITFVGDDPAATASPQVTTTVRFNYATIDFSQEQSGAVIAQWSAAMDANDYFALQEIITSYELLGQSDITVTPAPCTGWSGLTVSMVYRANTYGFAILPEVCDPVDWTTGVSALVTLKDELVARYAP